MSKTNFDDIIKRSLELRKKYHELEKQHLFVAASR